jgi:uncharacterized membrane protein
VTGVQVGVLVAGILTSGLLAGLFYAFSCAVMPGLARTDDATFVRAVRATNEAILNGWFAASFLGAPVLTALALATVLAGQGPGAAALWSGGAVLAHLVTWVITARVHLPLNKQVAAAGDSAGEYAEVRATSEARWWRWNIVRTLTSTMAFACLVGAVLALGAAT